MTLLPFLHGAANGTGANLLANARVLIVSLAFLAACLGPCGCSKQQTGAAGSATPGPPATPAATAEPLPATPAALPDALDANPDALAARRAALAARIDKLTDSECDMLVLRFQLIPRDEVLDPLSKPRNELLRYINKVASEGQLSDIERDINDRKKWPRQ